MRRRNRRKLEFAAFLIPVVILFGVVGYQLYASYAGPSRGVLVVQATLEAFNGLSANASLPFTMDGAQFETPARLSLQPGLHNVTFSALPWYNRPASRDIIVPSGTTTYAIGTYAPVRKVAGVTPTSLNSTRLTALHAVTPVTWVNTSSQEVTVEAESVGSIPLNPGSKFTYVYPTPGAFSFNIFGNSTLSGQVQVY